MPSFVLSFVYTVDRGVDSFVCELGTRLSPTVPQISVEIGPNEDPRERALIAGRIYLETNLEFSQVEVRVNK